MTFPSEGDRVRDGQPRSQACKGEPAEAETFSGYDEHPEPDWEEERRDEQGLRKVRAARGTLAESHADQEPIHEGADRTMLRISFFDRVSGGALILRAA